MVFNDKVVVAFFSRVNNTMALSSQEQWLINEAAGGGY
jgi:hypothetical protein